MKPITMAHRVFRWNLAVFAGLVLSVLLLVAMNYIVDPYLVFHSDVMRPSVTSNERYNKVEHLLNNPGRYDSFMIGSSLMGVYDPDVANALRPGHHYYNLSVFSGTAVDEFEMLSALHAHGQEIREVIIGIDAFPFKAVNDTNRDASMRHHPVVLGKSTLNYFGGYLFVSSFRQSLAKLVDHNLPEASFKFDFNDTGVWQLLAYEKRIQTDPVTYAAEMFKKPLPVTADVAWVDGRFGELEKLVEWLQEHQVRVFAFIHPFSQQQQNTMTAESYNEFRRRVHAIIPSIVDFSGREDITGNVALYYEPKHYRPGLAAYLLAQLLGTPDHTTAIARLN